MVLEVAKLFVKEIFCLHGMPKTFVFDRYAKFTSNFWQDIFKAIGTELNMSTTFHLQKDGKIERVNCFLQDILECMRMRSKQIGLNSCLWMSLLTIVHGIVQFK